MNPLILTSKKTRPGTSNGVPIFGFWNYLGIQPATQRKQVRPEGLSKNTPWCLEKRPEKKELYPNRNFTMNNPFVFMYSLLLIHLGFNLRFFRWFSHKKNVIATFFQGILPTLKLAVYPRVLGLYGIFWRDVWWSWESKGTSPPLLRFPQEIRPY